MKDRNERLQQLLESQRAIQAEIREIRDQIAAELREPVEKRIAYREARREHAYRLREEGLTFREIGERIDTSDSMARELYIKQERRIRLGPSWYMSPAKLEKLAAEAAKAAK